MPATEKSEAVAPYVHDEPTQLPAAPRSEQAEVLAIIGDMAKNPDIPIDRLKELMGMKERLDDRAREERGREAEAAYYRAMAECQAELKVVVKNKNNTQTKSQYADLAALARQADPIIHRHGFTTSFQPGGKTEKGEERVRWTIAHTAGHVERGEACLSLDDRGAQGSVNKTPLHAFGSTMSYGRRYLKLMLFDIATGDDDDGNAAGSDTVTPEQYNLLFNLMAEAGADEKFLRIYAVEDPRDLPVRMFEPAKALLQQRIAAKKAQADA